MLDLLSLDLSTFHFINHFPLNQELCNYSVPGSYKGALLRALVVPRLPSLIGRVTNFSLIGVLLNETSSCLQLYRIYHSYSTHRPLKLTGYPHYYYLRPLSRTVSRRRFNQKQKVKIGKIKEKLIQFHKLSEKS